MNLKKAFAAAHDYFKQHIIKTAAFDKAMTAIAQGDAAGFETIYQQHVFSDPKAKELFLQSIQHDQPEIFHSLLNREYKGDVNHAIYSFDNTGPGGPIYTREEPVLNYALARGATKIAQSLLDSPAINIFKRGHSVSTVYQLGGHFAGACHVTQEPEMPSALEISREHGMSDISAKIIKRVARKL